MVTDSPDTFTLTEHFFLSQPAAVYVTPAATYVFGLQVRLWCLATLVSWHWLVGCMEES